MTTNLPAGVPAEANLTHAPAFLNTNDKAMWVHGFNECRQRTLTAAQSLVSPAKPRCQYCDGTGDVHGLDGEWRGDCTECKPVTPTVSAALPFQTRVQPWMLECFGPKIAADQIERNHRFFEEASELVQSLGMTASEAHQLVDYTFNRPQGAPHQEVGGVMVTLAALCLAAGIDMHDSGEVELTRIWGNVEQIRAKQAAKPKHSPLPEAPTPPTSAADAVDAARYRWLRDPKTDVALVLDKRTGYVPPDENITGLGGYHTYEYRAGDELDDAIDVAIAASKGQL